MCLLASFCTFTLLWKLHVKDTVARYQQARIHKRLHSLFSSAALFTTSVAEHRVHILDMTTNIWRMNSSLLFEENRYVLPTKFMKPRTLIS